MDIKWLQTFVTAAEYENFRKTSEILYISQPTVTLHIKNLEILLETTLFEKKGRNIILTEAGQIFLPDAKKMIETYDSSLKRVDNWKQGYDKKLTIAIAPFIASSIFPMFLKKFFEENPHIDVTINVVKSPDIGQEVNHGKADLGISRMIPNQTQLSFESIWDDQVILVAPKNELETESFKEEDIFQKYKLITHNHPVYWDDLLPRIRALYPKVRTMMVTQVEITKQFIMAGLGISFLPKLFVQKELLQGDLIYIPTKQLDLPTSHMYFVTKRENKEVIDFKLALFNFLKNY
jgi:LysR family transcriptional repressor of citA